MVAQRSRLGERVQVAKRKGQAHRRAEFDGDHLVLVILGVLAHGNVRFTNVTRSRKLDAILRHADAHRIADGRQVAADALKLNRRHSECDVIVRLRNPQVFAVDVHELQFKVRNLLLICQAWKGVVSSVVWRFEHVRVSSRSYTRSFARARRHAPGDSNMNVTVSPASSAFIVIASSLPAHFNIFACEEFKIKPAKLVSQLHRTRPPRARAHHRARARGGRVRCS